MSIITRIDKNASGALAEELEAARVKYEDTRAAVLDRASRRLVALNNTITEMQSEVRELDAVVLSA